MSVRKLIATATASLAVIAAAMPASAQQYRGGHHQPNYGNNSLRRGDGLGMQQQPPFATAYNQFNQPLFQCVALQYPRDSYATIQVVGADPYTAIPDMTILRTRDGSSTGANADSKGGLRYENSQTPQSTCENAFNGRGLRNEKLGNGGGFSGGYRPQPQGYYNQRALPQVYGGGTPRYDNPRPTLHDFNQIIQPQALPPMLGAFDGKSAKGFSKPYGDPMPK